MPMTIIERCFAIRSLLKTKEWRSVSDVFKSAEWDVGIRTIRRDLATLTDINVLEHERTNGIDRYRLKKS